jgi:uncharacterized protein
MSRDYGLAPREIEERCEPVPVELRSGGPTERRVGGLAAVFGKRSQPLGGFIEIVENKAFSKCAGDGFAGVVCRYEHDSLLGTTAAKTLRLNVDSRGLDYEVDLPNTTAGNDVFELTQRTDLRASSFAFQVYDQEWTHEDGIPVRHLTSVRLIDVAPVTTPAYPDATVGLRSLAVQFDADEAEVFELARQGELRKMFTRTDRPAETRTGAQALRELMAMAPSDHRTPMTPAQMKRQLTEMAMPCTGRSAHQARAELTAMALPDASVDPKWSAYYGMAGM